MVEARAGAIKAAADPRVRMKIARALLALAAATALTPAAFAQGASGLLFRASGDNFALEQAGEDPSVRPDLGIGVDDLSLKGRILTVIVHSLGSAAAPGGTLFLEDPSGRTLASTKIAAPAAPTDRSPGTARVRLTVPAGVAVDTLRLRLAIGDGGREVTMRNNALPLAAVTRR